MELDNDQLAKISPEHFKLLVSMGLRKREGRPVSQGIKTVGDGLVEAGNQIFHAWDQNRQEARENKILKAMVGVGERNSAAMQNISSMIGGGAPPVAQTAQAAPAAAPVAQPAALPSPTPTPSSMPSLPGTQIVPESSAPPVAQVAAPKPQPASRDVEAQPSGFYGTNSAPPVAQAPLRPAAPQPAPTRSPTMTRDQYDQMSRRVLMSPDFERLKISDPTRAQMITERLKLMAPPEPKLEKVGDELVRIGADGVPSVIHRADKSTDDMRNYESYARQEAAAGRQPKSFMEWGTEWRKAAAASTVIDNKAESAEAKGRGEGIAKRFNKLADDGIDADNDIIMMQRLTQLNSAVTPGAKTAILNEIRARTGIALDPNANNVQAYQAMLDYMTPRMREAGSGASSDRDVRIFQGALPRLLGTPEGNALAVETLGGMAKRRQMAADIAKQWQLGEISGKEADARLKSLPDPFQTFRGWAEANGQMPMSQKAPGAMKPAPQTGAVEQGYRFKGGNPADPNSWEKVN